jgi:hypothetical protein
MKPARSRLLVPHKDTLHKSVSALLELGSQYFLPEAIELLRQLEKNTRLSDDQVLLLAITAAQALRSYYVEPNGKTSDEILSAIVGILDHEEVIRAEYNKLYELFRESDGEALALDHH